MSELSDEEIERVWAQFDELSAVDLARRWLAATGSDEVVMYAYDVWERKGAEFYSHWLAALIALAAGERQIGSVGAGPVEASLERNLDLAEAVEALVERPKLATVLRCMWFDDATPEVKRWALGILHEDEQAPDGPKLPRGLVDPSA